MRPSRPGLLLRGACLVLGLATASAAKPLSEDEGKVVRRCEAIFQKGLPASVAEPVFLNPTKASVCLKVLAISGTVSNKMASDRLDPDAWKRVNRVLMQASALKDLADVFSLQKSSGPLRVALSQRSFCSGPLADIGLGPSPKLLQDWAARYRPAQAPLLELVMKSWSWDSLPEAMHPHLLAKLGAASGADWDASCLEKRFRTLFYAAARAADDLLAVPAASLGEEALARMRRTAGGLQPYLEEAKAAALAEHLANVERYLALRKRYAGSSGLSGVKDAARLEEYSRLAKEGKLSVSEHMRYLSGIFGEETGKGDVDRGPGKTEKPSTLWPFEESLAALLIPAMQDEIKGTRSGERVLSFYKDQAYPAKDRGLVLKISPLGSNLGMYNGESIVISRENIEAWMLKRGVASGADIVNAKDRRLLRELSRYLAPTFVHEAVHQEQRAWLLKNGQANRYYVEREVEAMGVGALFVLEKNLQESRKGDAAYLQSIHSLEVDRARRLYEDGLTGVRRFVAPAYSQIASFDKYSAEDFELADAIDAELARRAQRPNDAEDDQWRAPGFSSLVGLVGRMSEIPDMKTEKLKELMRTTLAGYRQLRVQLDRGDEWLVEGLKAYKKSEEVKR